ncbi:MAG: Gfo/Idh/MocA family oxidoreductase [Deltaproteobacteria bacterium]|jgi:predicted dehydrogenase|nr:Gfo/Idh/MocA family oxidoreductase [Deltaproteobacteria bacterium]MDO8957870.1 Gfo/Idh/MocA family oxidoreductase [Deltaproteobacteria bacterium]MDP3039304.1 Gfo/Idh/MocA family oxidoreductase [Deltaproteobacteria bacterium]
MTSAASWIGVNINPNDTVMAYAPSPHIFGEEYIAEKLETKAGWNFASPDEDWVRGYPQELEDFVECLLTGREPDSGLELAFQTVEAIYAAYLSAEKGMRVELEKRPPLTT